MKVNFATTWESQCGVANYSRELVGELAKKVNIEIVSLDFSTAPKVGELAAKLNSGDLAHVQFQYPFCGGMRFHRNWFPKLLRDIRVPLVVTIHELDLGDNELLFWRIYKRWLNNRLFAQPEIDRLIVHSSEHRRKILNLGVEPEDIRIIPLWVPKVVHIDISQEEAKASLGLSGRKVVTIFGFVVKRKGYDLALDSLCSWPADTVLLIAGGPHVCDRTDYFSHLQQRIDRERLSDRVRITGYVSDDDVPVVMAATDLVAAPFIEMSSSWSMMYAIAYGKPIIASNLPQNQELNSHAHCLVLFKAGSSRDFAQKLGEVIQDKSRLEALSTAARNYAATRTVVHAAKETLKVYEELVVA
jgi:glycosyltransferase involved in cell wall biosynthesis